MSTNTDEGPIISNYSYFDGPVILYETGSTISLNLLIRRR